MSAKPDLRVVTGELPVDGPQTFSEALAELADKDDVIAGLERDIRGWAIRYRNLERDRDQEARDSDEWPILEQLFGEWKRATRHFRSPFTLDRYEVALPFLRNPKYGEEMIRRGIRGIAFDHFSRQNRRGKTERYDGWEHLFKNAGAFERYVNRAPDEEGK